MAKTKFYDSVSGGNELNGLAGPAAATRLEALFDAVQTEEEKRWSLARGWFAVPTVTLDESGQKVDVSGVDGILAGCRITTAGSVSMVGKTLGTYYLMADTASTFSAATSQDAAKSLIGTFNWNPAGSPKFSAKSVTAAIGIQFDGDSRALSQWVPRGTWTSGLAYRGNTLLRDVVTYNGSCYVCLADHTAGASTEPGVGGSWATDWQVLASKGAKGDKGDAGGLVNPRGAWLSGVAYDADAPDTVVGSDGNGYVCILDHTSDASTEPGVGGSWSTAWRLYVNKGTKGDTGDDGAGWNAAGAWATSTAYAITPDIDWVTHNGNSYACLQAHTSGATTEPGVGVDWATCWQQMAQKGAAGDPMDWTGAWVTSTVYVAGQGVNRLGSSFYCILGHTADAASEPGVGASWTTYWDYIALKGTAGTDGTDGADGADGADGTNGTDGIGYHPMGAWVLGESYATTPAIDTVYVDGSTYYCIMAHTSTADDEPGVGVNGPTYWALLAAGGVAIMATHASSHAAAGNDPVTPAAIGAATTGALNTVIASLGSKADLVDGVVPANQLPSYVDDIIEAANAAAFPGTGEAGKIYVARDTNLTYRWSGSGYTEVSQSLALGETAATAYRGDRGKDAYDHSQDTHDLDFLADVAITSAEQGDVLLRTSTGWVNLHHGVAGEVLQTGGHGVDAAWAKISRRMRFALPTPKDHYDNVSHIFPIITTTDAALTISAFNVSCLDDPATELDADLKYADALIGLANAATLGALDTTAGVSSGSGLTWSVPAGKTLYLSFGAQPDANIKMISMQLIYTYD